jgi:hypothetical protein
VDPADEQVLGPGPESRSQDRRHQVDPQVGRA